VVLIELMVAWRLVKKGLAARFFNTFQGGNYH
jgi:hypothetical protein